MAGLDDNAVLLVRGTASGVAEVTGNRTLTNSGDGEATGVLVGNDVSGPFADSRALVFSGDDFLSCPQLTIFGTGSNWTIDFWAKNLTGNYVIHLFSATYGSACGGIYSGNMITALSQSYGGWLWIGSMGSPASADWVHYAIIAGEVDGIGGFRTYRNGILQATKTPLTALWQPVGAALNIGRYVDPGAYYITGQIAELRISNIARDPAVFPPTAHYTAPGGKNLIDGFDGRLIN